MEDVTNILFGDEVIKMVKDGHLAGLLGGDVSKQTQRRLGSKVRALCSFLRAKAAMLAIRQMIVSLQAMVALLSPQEILMWLLSTST